LTVFVDTSALLAVLDADDQRHQEADAAWRRLMSSDEELLTTNYVLVEMISLAQRRLGLEAVRVFAREIEPVLQVQWLDAEIHQAALDALLAAARRKLSVVDCDSFEVMRRREVHRAFAFDNHFEEQGFDLLKA
jgi:predicted nucleic acid-binding protein